MLDKIEKESAHKQHRLPDLVPDNTRIQQLRSRLFHVEELRPMIDNANTRNYNFQETLSYFCLLYTSPSPRDLSTSRMPSSA